MKKASLLCLALLLSLSLAPIASADGMAYKKRYVYIDPEQDLTKEEWSLLAETEQTASIDYNNGRERLSIAIGVETKARDADEAVWIFPIPARPRDSRIFLNLDVPRFIGNELGLEAGERIWGFAHGMRDTLGLPLLYGLLSAPSIWDTVGGTTSTAGISLAEMNLKDRVVVHERVKLHGVTAELITAEYGATIADYLESKGFDLPREAADVLDIYVEGDYSFVVGWISDYRELMSAQSKAVKRLIGVSVEFPADKLYFPLVPTSIYGSRTIPINVYVTGYVSPNVYGDIAPYTKVTHYINDKAENELQKKFTHVRINAPSTKFTSDLWIDNTAPLSASIADSIVYHDYVWFVVFMLVFSILISLFMGSLLFYEKGVRKLDLVILGAINLLTIIPFILAVFFWDFKNHRFSDWKGGADGVSRNERIAFLIAFIIIFVVVSYGIEAAWGVEPREGTWEEAPYYPYPTANRINCELTACTNDADCLNAPPCRTLSAYCNVRAGVCDVP